MPIIGILIIFQSNVYHNIPSQYQYYIYLIVLFFTLIIPISIFPLLKYWNAIESISLDNRKDRFLPLVISTLCFYITHFFILKIGGPRLISLFTFSMSLASLLVLIITLFWKISLHMTGLGGITALILAITLTYKVDLFTILVIAVVLSGFLASIRLYLQVHNLSQVLVGYLAGFSSVIVSYYFFLV